jgi:hypothetical protein
MLRKTGVTTGSWSERRASESAHCDSDAPLMITDPLHPPANYKRALNQIEAYFKNQPDLGTEASVSNYWQLSSERRSKVIFRSNYQGRVARSGISGRKRPENTATPTSQSISKKSLREVSLKREYCGKRPETFERFSQK